MIIKKQLNPHFRVESQKPQAQRVFYMVRNQLTFFVVRGTYLCGRDIMRITIEQARTQMLLQLRNQFCRGGLPYSSIYRRLAKRAQIHHTDKELFGLNTDQFLSIRKTHSKVLFLKRISVIQAPYLHK
jgi:hypothetical protein